MNRFIFFSAMAIVLSAASAALAFDSTALIGKWQLVEKALDSKGKPCPFVGQKIEFTADGKMISANMPVPFRYKVNPDKADVAEAIARNPELEGMEIMLAKMGNSKRDPFAYGVQLKDSKFIMKVSGYTPAVYKKLK
jgi:hypothetical protein